MKSYYSYLTILFSIVLFGFLGDCMGEGHNSKKTEIYYGSFAGYGIPLKPIEKIDHDEALSRNAYCVGFYNDKGQLSRFEKHLNGRLFFRHSYSYHGNGKIKKNTIIDADGKAKTNHYDESGKPLKP